jgi:murein DD-endopeptidase MepM/ murein hydrolase activator NlpD
MMRSHFAALLIATTTLGGCTAVDNWSDGSRPPGTAAGYVVSAQPGETLESLSARFDLPPDAIIQANHLRAPYTLQPHQQLVIPPPATYKVHAGDTVEEIASLLGVDDAALAHANGLTQPYHMHVGQILRVPGGYGDGGLARDAGPDTDPNMAYVPPGAPAVTPRSAIQAQTLAPPPAAGPPSSYAPPPVSAPPPSSQGRPLAPSPTQPAYQPPPAASRPIPVAPPQAAPPMATPPGPPAQQAMVAPVPTASGTHFIRPVGGEIIQGFGGSTGGQTNDGINIAAAAGTPVKAADSGTVIYTGNELAAFGNLVLIRHAGGWVTAYGHLAKIDVQRGSTVTQGQPIGSVGQTGSATVPQLHFEIRQGSKPVDPAPFLNGRG